MHSRFLWVPAGPAARRHSRKHTGLYIPFLFPGAENISALSPHLLNLRSLGNPYVSADI